MFTHAHRNVAKGGLLTVLVALFAALAVLVSPLAHAAPVGNDEDPAITIKSKQHDQDLAAYQIFKGQQSPLPKEGADPTEPTGLTMISWGEGIDKDGLLKELGESTDPAFAAITGKENAAELAAKFSGLTGADATKLSKIVAKHIVRDDSYTPVNFTLTPSETEEGIYEYTAKTVDAGYYVVVDRNPAKVTAATSPILKVVGPVTVDVKTSVPSHDKQVEENSTNKLGETADYNIGDDVPFVLHGTLPSNYADFDSYKYGFRDTLSKGFDDPQNVKVYVDDKEITEGFTVSAVKPASDTEGHYAGGKTFSVDFADLKKAAPNATADSKIDVKYTAKLNDKAAIDDKGNGNKSLVYFQKSALEGEGDHEGKTPEDHTWVFTYTVENTKVDRWTGDKLSGAEFVLTRGFTYNGDGSLDSSENGEFAILDSNEKVIGWTPNQDDATTVVTKADAPFSFKGLDAGNYALRETKAPTGYQLPTNDMRFGISAEHQENAENGKGELTKLSLATVDGKGAPGDLSTATMKQDVTNSSGSDLPSTGGMGTVLFTAGGLAVMLLAGFGIVARNRKRAEA
ncbi:hypothetical protein DAD186_17370 [Dermabacter vaginalis]|uniref:Gram-positive cocci surface proteins LPxTG domain-containing protein n=1 Tax=Dermabacter vaginalis TaxID=1630135 RepID=A0A1B0ZK70_9MICO|nr:isopeptide-forming domain-containing fimbrial protein [Dermabacter vaginalis]ANP28287.1 hypothetical protein DAD186_17370 [Dermabacter vaginalis]